MTLWIVVYVALTMGAVFVSLNLLAWVLNAIYTLMEPYL